VRVSYYYGINADMAGGEYARGSSFIVQDESLVFPFPDTASVSRYSTLQQAIDFAVGQLATHAEAAVEIVNSETYASLTLAVDVPADKTLELRAADETRPTLLLDDKISVTGEDSSSFYLHGLLIAASPAMIPGSPSPVALVHVPRLRPDGSPNQLETLGITHITLVPGWAVDPHGAPQFGTAPALVAEPAGLAVTVAKSILGSVRAPELVTFNASDSIIDATEPANAAYAALDGVGPGGALTLQGCTVLGKTHSILLALVSDSIFWAALVPADAWPTALISDRKQEGCVRFSFLPKGAKTPRRFECIEQTIAGPQPIFFATRYGRPGYMKLLASTPDVVRRGADDSGEMGAFHFVLGPLREADLRIRMQEYLPVGLEFGVIYQN
jgi:hypothetical protein